MCMEDFERFTVDNWRSVAVEAKQSLRNKLLQRGVYVRGGSNQQISKSFMHTGYEEWPEEIERPRHDPRYRPLGRLSFNRLSEAEEQWNMNQDKITSRVLDEVSDRNRNENQQRQELIDQTGSCSFQTRNRLQDEEPRRRPSPQRQIGTSDQYGHIPLIENSSKLRSHSAQPPKNSAPHNRGATRGQSSFQNKLHRQYRITQQVGFLQDSYLYDKMQKFNDKNDDDFYTKVAIYEQNLSLYSIDKSVWVLAFRIMLTGQALLFFSTNVTAKFDLKTLPYDRLVEIFRQRYNTPERQLMLWSEWTSIDYALVSSMFPTASVSEKVDYIIDRLNMLRVYLKPSGPSDFIHRHRLLHALRNSPECPIARIHREAPWHSVHLESL